MFNKQLRQNIKMLDVQIGELSRELEGLKKDTKYDVKMRTLDDLIRLRGVLTQGKRDDEKSDVVIELDRQIEELATLISKVDSDEDYIAKMKKLDDLTKLRCQLSEVKSKESITPILISSGVTLSGLILVLRYEKAEIITSKAFNIVTKMFRG